MQTCTDSPRSPVAAPGEREMLSTYKELKPLAGMASSSWSCLQRKSASGLHGAGRSAPCCTHSSWERVSRGPEGCLLDGQREYSCRAGSGRVAPTPCRHICCKGLPSRALAGGSQNFPPAACPWVMLRAVQCRAASLSSHGGQGALWVPGAGARSGGGGGLGSLSRLCRDKIGAYIVGMGSSQACAHTPAAMHGVGTGWRTLGDPRDTAGGGM